MIYRALTAVAGAALRGAAPLAGETLAERLALDDICLLYTSPSPRD